MLRRLAILSLVVIATPALADGNYRRHHHKPHHYYRAIERERDGDDRRDGWHCLPPVRGLGTQWIGENGALSAAKKDWMERTRYDHGESYVDMTHAKDFEKRCGRVSIGEVAGQVTYRCEILAKPCKAEFTEGRVTK